MSDFPNAPAPHGALFDNAPTVTQPVPSHLIPATRISQIKGGQWVALDVYMQYGKPLALDLALKRVSIGRTVFVAREDAKTVLASVASKVDRCDHE